MESHEEEGPPGGDKVHAQALIGAVLCQRYRLLELLGRGGSSLVFEAEHVGIGRRCAVKILHPDLVSKQATVRRFRREAKRVGAIVHENVVQVFDFDVDGGSPFLVMERLHGRTLRELLDQEGRLPWPRAVELLLQVCAGAQAAHSLGLVHRDLKPENVFVVVRGAGECAKILDFGVAKALYGEESVQSTRSGTLLGTLRYMAPEQLRNPADVDARADVYGLGLMLYELLTARVAFGQTDLHALMQQVLFERPVPLGRLAPELPAELVACVERASARDPAQRFPSAEDLAAALRAAQRAGFTRGGTQVTTQEHEVRLPHVPQPRRALGFGPLPPMGGPEIHKARRPPDRPTLREVARRCLGVLYISLPLLMATALAAIMLIAMLRAF